MILSTFPQKLSYSQSQNRHEYRCDTIYLCHESHRHIEVQGSMRRKSAQERVCEDEERRGNDREHRKTKRVGFILHLRTFGTFDVTLCWWIMVKVMLFINGRLIRAIATKIRSLVSDKSIVYCHVNIYNCILIKLVKTS